MGQRLIDALVGVLQVDVFADHGDLDLLFRADHTVDELPPVGQVGRRRFQVEQLADEGIEPLGVQHERHLVDGVLDVPGLDHALRRNVAEHGKLLPDIGIERMFGAADEHLAAGCRSRAACAMLCWVGFVFSSPAALMKGTSVTCMMTTFSFPTSSMNWRMASRKGSPSMSPVVPPISVMTTSALDSSRNLADPVLDLVGHVRDHLDRLAEVIAAAFLQDDAFVDLAAGQVVVAREDTVGETLVMPEVEIGLGAVVQDVDFAMLERVHRARIDVEIGIELLKNDAEPAQLQQGAEGRGGQAFPERTDNAAGDEDVFHRPAFPRRVRGEFSSAAARRTASPGVSTPAKPCLVTST